MTFTEWTKKSKDKGGYYESTISLFAGHDPIAIVRFWETGPIVVRGYFKGKIDHMVGHFGMCTSLGMTIDELKTKAKEVVVDVFKLHIEKE